MTGTSSSEHACKTKLPSTAEQLAAIQSTFGLNKSQLTVASSVKRQTIYDWYAGNFEVEGSNSERLAAPRASLGTA
jgi:hypothetical protein